MLNKEATHWLLYVENKRGILMCITPHKEWMIERRETHINGMPDTAIITHYMLTL